MRFSVLSNSLLAFILSKYVSSLTMFCAKIIIEILSLEIKIPFTLGRGVKEERILWNWVHLITGIEVCCLQPECFPYE